MSQLTLEFSNREDLALVLSFAKRLKVHVVSLVSSDSNVSLENRREMLKKAASDPIFLADIDAISEDFKHLDIEMR